MPNAAGRHQSQFMEKNAEYRIAIRVRISSNIVVTSFLSLLNTL
jgi:hypothetical protein